MKVCSVEECSKTARAKGYCPMHYQRQRLHGSIHHTRHKETRPEMEARFWSRVKETAGCWLWQGRIGRAGYGLFDCHHREYRAHRLAYELRVSNIPAGMVVDHICHTLACVRPDHLRLATAKQNAENRKGGNCNGRSGIRGVRMTESGRWIGQVTHNYVRHTKYFGTQEEAIAYVTATRLELFTHTIEKRIA